MVAPGNVNPTGRWAPAPPEQPQHAIKAAGVAEPAIGHQGADSAHQGSLWTPSASQHSMEVLQQRSKLPFCPARMAIGGFAITVIIGYFTLYSTKKKEDAALDAAKVVTGTAVPENTHHPTN